MPDVLFAVQGHDEKSESVYIYTHVMKDGRRCVASTVSFIT